PASPFGAESIRQHLQNIVELLARQFLIGIRRTHKVIQLLLIQFLADGGSNHLLRKEIERFPRDLDRIQSAVADAPQDRQTFDQFVTTKREKPPLRNAYTPVVRSSNALKKCCYRTG